MLNTVAPMEMKLCNKWKLTLNLNISPFHMKIREKFNKRRLLDLKRIIRSSVIQVMA